MTRRTALALCGTALLSVAAFAGDVAKAPACCSKKAHGTTAAKNGKLRCTLTGKEIDKCCCEPREGGKMYCTLAKREVDKCCCTEVKTKQASRPGNAV